jgi:hypothetical protein
LIFHDHGDAVGVVGVAAGAGRGVNGQAGVIGELSAGETLRIILVIQRIPRP